MASTLNMLRGRAVSNPTNTEEHKTKRWIAAAVACTLIINLFQVTSCERARFKANADAHRTSLSKAGKWFSFDREYDVDHDHNYVTYVGGLVRCTVCRAHGRLPEEND